MCTLHRRLAVASGKHGVLSLSLSPPALWPGAHCPCRLRPPCPADLPAGTAQLLRSVSLFSLVNALAEKLRGVFVPYYGLLLNACVAHLTGEWLN